MSTPIGSVRLTKRQWYDAGGFSESRCWRRMRSGSWQYFWRCC